MSKKETKKFDRISLYLLKEDKEPKDVIKERKGKTENLQQYNELNEFMIMYGKTTNQPAWIHFYGIEDNTLINSRTYCLFFVKFNCGPELSNQRWMVVCHGTGYQQLKMDYMERNFGLLVVLNSVDHDQITNVNSITVLTKVKSFSGNNRVGGKADELRIGDMDLLKKMSGKVKANDSGADKFVSGCDILTVRFSESKSVEELPEVCLRYFNTFNELTYLKLLLTNVQAILDVKTTKDLDQLLAETINRYVRGNNFTDLPITLNIPWAENLFDLKYMRFIEIKEPKEKFYDDWDFGSYLNALTPSEMKVFEDNEEGKIIEQLEKHQCRFFYNDEKNKSWSIKWCINFQTQYNGGQYFLIDGVWCKLGSNYYDRIQKKLDAITVSLQQSKLISYNLKEIVSSKDECKKEFDYNKFVADKKGYLLLDCEIITVKPNSKGRHKFEICDLLTKDGHLIHVKFSGATAKLGHLFNQGLISGTILQNEKLPVLDKIGTLNGGTEFLEVISLDADKLTVHFAVIAKENKKELLIPAMILLYDATKQLENLGYKVVFEWVHDESPTNEPPPKVSKKSQSTSPVKKRRKLCTPNPNQMQIKQEMNDSKLDSSLDTSVENENVSASKSLDSTDFASPHKEDEKSIGSPNNSIFTPSPPKKMKLDGNVP